MKCVSLLYVFEKFTLFRSKWNIGLFMDCSIILFPLLSLPPPVAAAELVFCSILNFSSVRLCSPWTVCDAVFHTELTCYVTNCVFPYAIHLIHITLDAHIFHRNHFHIYSYFSNSFNIWWIIMVCGGGFFSLLLLFLFHVISFSSTLYKR